MVKWLELICFLTWILAVVNGYQSNLAKIQTLKVGASCNTKTSEPGVCKSLSKCGVYLEGLQRQTIEYSSIAICEHKFYNEVVCCPDTPSNPQLPNGFRASETFKGTETLTEGPFEIPFEGQSVPEKVLTAGSICQTKTGETGVCKLLSACKVYYKGLQKQTIEYSSILICSFMDKDEVVCCPNNNLPTNHNAIGHIPTEPPRIPGPPFTGTTPSQSNTEFGRPKKIMKSGAICQTKTGEPGVCKLLSACGVYMEGLQKETIEYSSILICSFMGKDEVVCCPNNHHRQGHIPTEPPRMPRPSLTGTKPSQNNTEIGRPGEILKSGAICQTKTGARGVCKLLSACGVYLEGLQRRTIEYNSIAICSYKWRDEVVCCPHYDTPSNPQSTTEFIASGPFNGPETVTEGPFERPAVPAKVLTAGSICKTKTDQPGVCKLLSSCGVYMKGLQKQTIEYSSILICSFIGKDEVVCCPNNSLRTNHNAIGHIPTEPPRMPRPPFTGTIPIPSENNTEIGRPKQNLKSGAICQTKTGEPGVCKLLSACGVYSEGLQRRTIKYNSIAICEHKFYDEVVCCPVKPSNPQLPRGFIASGPFNAPETVTEGPFEQPAVPEKVLTAGSICQTKTGETGVCKLLSGCKFYYKGLQKQTIEYSSIRICSFIDKDEVICCPNNSLRTNHNAIGHIPTEPPRMQRPPFTRTIPIQKNTEIGRPEKILKSGSICKTKTGEPGFCKLLSACGVYMEGLQKQTIEYNSIFICSFMGKDEVVCCPNNNLPTVHNTLRHIPTEPPRMPRPPFTGIIPRQSNTEVERPLSSSKNIKRPWLMDRNNAPKNQDEWKVFKNTSQTKSSRLMEGIEKLCNFIGINSCQKSNTNTYPSRW